MLAILHTLGMFIVDLFKSRRRLEAENLFLRHQLNKNPDGVPGNPQALLGAEILGPRIFLHDQR
jgi:hypothetical protein